MRIGLGREVILIDDGSRDCKGGLDDRLEAVDSRNPPRVQPRPLVPPTQPASGSTGEPRCIKEAISYPCKSNSKATTTT
jgi:hypothetical protein